MYLKSTILSAIFYDIKKTLSTEKIIGLLKGEFIEKISTNLKNLGINYFVLRAKISENLEINSKLYFQFVKKKIH